MPQAIAKKGCVNFEKRDVFVRKTNQDCFHSFPSPFLSFLAALDLECPKKSRMLNNGIFLKIKVKKIRRKIENAKKVYHIKNAWKKIQSY